MSATMLAPGMSRGESRNATKRGARNSRLSWVSSTTLALPPPALDMRARRIAETLPVDVSGAFNSGGGRCHDRADVAAGPDDVLQASAKGR